MTSHDYGELVRRARSWVKPEEIHLKMADAIEQQARELAEEHRHIERLVKYRNALHAELIRHKHVTAMLMAAWPKGVPMPEWEEPAEPNTRGTEVWGERMG
jgi:hypothetical protein